jgi:hypothetical protein
VPFFPTVKQVVVPLERGKQLCGPGIHLIQVEQGGQALLPFDERWRGTYRATRDPQMLVNLRKHEQRQLFGFGHHSLLLQS